MTWIIPIHGDHIKLGSDGAFACHWKRADKRREFFNYIRNKSYGHETITEMYEITETQFQNLNILDPEVLRKYGRKV